jgi:hypothetical protein
MAFTSLRCVLNNWLKKRKLKNFFDENLKEGKKRVKIVFQRKKSVSKN